MTRHEADAWFLRYRRHGDAKALARVFDLVAPEVLLVAAHFARQGGDPEDLLQATFLAAIEAAPRWNESRPLLPWLLGILANCARAERRRRLRAPMPDGALEPSATTADPLDQLADAETAAELERALRALPQPYRHTMTLRWVHGLTPLQIAHSLGAPPATVKSQLQRGLALLREALPTGIASALLLAVAPRAALAQVKERVLAAASAHATPRAGSAARPFGIVLGCGLLVLATWVTLRPAPERAEKSAHDPARVGPSRGDADPVAERDRAPALADARLASGPPREGSAQRHLVVRVRHAGDAAPAPLVHVGLQPAFLADPRLHELWSLTDAAGLARFEVPFAGEARVFAERGGETKALLDGGSEEVVELEIPHGLETHVHVVDEERRSIADAEILVSRAGLVDDVVVLARTDAAGRAIVRGLEPGRALSARVAGRGHAALFVVREATSAAAPLELVLAGSARRIAGSVLTHDGLPVANAAVLLGTCFPTLRPPARHGSLGFAPPHWLRTDAQGLFVSASFVATHAPTPLFVGAVGHPSHAETLAPDASPDAITVRLPHPAELRGSVRDREGKPVARARIECIDPRLVGVRRTPIGPPWTHSVGWSGSDGAFAFPGLAPGRRAVFAAASDGRRANTSLDLAPGSLTEWQAVVEVPRPLHGFVRDQGGEPLAGWRVLLASPRGDYVRGPATTDAAGRFTIEECDAGAYHVRAHDPASAWPGAAVTVIGAIPGRPVELVATRRADAFVTGRLVDADGLGIEAELVLRAGERGELRTASSAAGAFRIGPVPAGAYTLSGRVRGATRASLADLVLEGAQTKDLGVLAVAPLGELALTIRVEREDARQAAFLAIHDTKGASFAAIATETGRQVTITLPEGEYFAVVHGAECAFASLRVQVRGGERVAHTLRVADGVPGILLLSHPYDGDDLEIRFALFDAEGTPLGGFLQPWRRGDAEPTTFRLRLAPGRYRVDATSTLGRTASATITITASPSDVPTPLRF